jgi:hypothetical protein
MTMVSPTARIEEHPDLVGLRMRYEQAAETRTAQFVDGLSFLAGAYLALSPWILGFNGLTTLTVSNLITGIAAAVFALGFASAFGRTHGIAWVAPIIGVWAIVSPWLVSGHVYTTRTITSNVIVGGVFVLTSLAAIGAGMRRARR